MPHTIRVIIIWKRFAATRKTVVAIMRWACGCCAVDNLPKQKLISEKNKDPLRTESSVVSAVQKGSSEALKIENTRTQRDNKIADNTLRTAKGVEKIIEAVKNIGNGGGIGFTVETAV